MSTWSDMMSAELEAEVTRINAGVYASSSDGAEVLVEPPTGPLGWGSDLVTITGPDGMQDIDPRALERAGDDPRVVLEALGRRIECGRGELPPEDEDPEIGEYGVDEHGVVGWLNRGFTPAQLNGKGDVLRLELSKDDRVGEDLRVTVARVGDNELAIELTGTLVPHDRTGAVPFSATFAVTSAGVLLKAFNLS